MQLVSAMQAVLQQFLVRFTEYIVDLLRVKNMQCALSSTAHKVGFT